MARLESYADRFETIRFERRDNILQVAIHHQGGEAVWDATETSLHNELGLAFAEIASDIENKIVIITGTGNSFCATADITATGIDTRDGWSRILREGEALIRNLLDIPVPVIGAVNGPALIHAELVLLSDIVIASELSEFADIAHVPSGLVPGDGAQVVWPMLLGPNRGRYFVLTGQRIPAAEALALGIVNEVLPHDQVLDRAWQLARQLSVNSLPMLRNTRAVLTRNLKRRMFDELTQGLALEGLSIL